MYLLDTDTSIFLLNRKEPLVEQRLRRLGPREVGISTITMAELFYGAAHSKRREANEKRVRVFCAAVGIFPFDEKSASLFGTTKEYLISQGEMIGAMDLLIASVALAHTAILVTHNIREFSRIPELKCEDWFHSVPLPIESEYGELITRRVKQVTGIAKSTQDEREILFEQLSHKYR